VRSRRHSSRGRRARQGEKIGSVSGRGCIPVQPPSYVSTLSQPSGHFHRAGYSGIAHSARIGRLERKPKDSRGTVLRAARFGLFRFEGMPNESSRVAYSGRATEYIDLLGSMSSVHPSDLQIVSTWAGDVHGNLIDAGCGPGHWTNFLT
jgi:hypothetical protein